MFSEIKRTKEEELSHNPVNVVYGNKHQEFTPGVSTFTSGGEMNLLQLNTAICVGELNELTAALCGNAPVMSAIRENSSGLKGDSKQPQSENVKEMTAQHF